MLLPIPDEIIDVLKKDKDGKLIHGLILEETATEEQKRILENFLKELDEGQERMVIFEE